MKKVGIVNFHFVDNFGAVLQCYALQEMVKKISGYNTEVIDYRPEFMNNDYRVFVNPLLYNNITTLSKIKIMIKNFLPRRLYNTYIRRTLFNRFRTNYLNLSSISFNLQQEKTKIANKYDYYITGSDQVWNPDMQNSLDDIYFLNFYVNNAKKISYAASIGSCSIDENYMDSFITLINNFDYVSIREESSVNFLSQYTDREMVVTLDPTLLLKKQDWSKVSSKNKMDKKYILVYDLEMTDEIVKIVNEISNKMNLSVISYQSCTKYDRGIESFNFKGPSEFLELYENADYVITSSFHGTVFAVVYEKNFLTVPHTTRGARMIDLLTKLGLEDRIIYTAEELSDDKIYIDIDYEEPLEKLEKEKNQSINYLKLVFNIKE